MLGVHNRILPTFGSALEKQRQPKCSKCEALRVQAGKSMAFQFSGFFVRGCDENEIVKNNDVACIKRLDKPFSGIGISIPKFTNTDPELDELLALSKSLGLDENADWMFMVYECFGGRIDYLYGYQNRKGAIFGPIVESSLEKVEDTYVEFMHNFGIGRNKALKFEPFERGYFDA